MLSLEKTQWGFKATDGSGLCWYGTNLGKLHSVQITESDRTSIPCVIGGELPTHIRVARCGHSSGYQSLELADLTLMRLATGSSRCRPGDRTGWTTVGMDYAVYSYLQFGDPDLVIFQKNGAGVRGLWVRSLAAASTVGDAITRLLSNNAVWDLCEVIMDAYDYGDVAGTHAARDRYEQAFVEGRLKKRKKNNTDSVRVWIEEKFEHV